MSLFEKDVYFSPITCAITHLGVLVLNKMLLSSLYNE